MITFLGGRLLIAMPGINDDRFERTVILVCAHAADHAIGLALNRPAPDLTTLDLFERLGVRTSPGLQPDPILVGGPVDMERGFVLHTDDFTCVDISLPVCPGVALTATRDVLEAMANRDRRPRRCLLALGYAGWGEGQLEDELRQNVWLTCEPDEDLLFDKDYLSKWTRALAKIGVSASSLSGQAGQA